MIVSLIRKTKLSTLLWSTVQVEIFKRLLNVALKIKNLLVKILFGRFFAQIISGLNYCHRRTDLNPINNGKNTNDSDL